MDGPRGHRRPGPSGVHRLTCIPGGAAVRRRTVVAGDHPDPDADLLRRRDRCPGGRAGRVDDADQGKQLQPGDQREQVGAGVKRDRVDFLARDSDHPQALLAQPLVLGQVPLPELAVRRHRPGVGGRRGPGQQLIGGAFDEAADDLPARRVFHRVERGHQLVGRIERQLGDPRVPFPGGDGGDAALGGQHDQRALGRGPDQLAVPDYARREQPDLHRVVVLAAERVPARLCLPGGELVGAGPLRPRGRLSRAETAPPVYPFGVQDLVGAERMPRHPAGRWRPSRPRCIRHSRRHVDSFLPSSRW